MKKRRNSRGKWEGKQVAIRTEIAKAKKNKTKIVKAFAHTMLFIILLLAGYATGLLVTIIK